jgi:hypothetical protein
MSNVINAGVKIGTFGLVDDITGVEGAQDSARDAARLQAASSDRGIAENRRQFDITQGNLKPFRDAGVGALEQQQALMGLSGNEAQEQAYNQFNESPGQRFLRQRQEKALLANASAIGGLGGGNVRTALQQQAVGFAQQDFDNQFSRLGQIAGQGQAATNTMGQFGAQNAANIAQMDKSGSEARASGILGAAQAETQFNNQLMQLGGQAAGAAMFASDIRLKENIVQVSSDDLGGVYEFNYINESQRYKGRMAQELLKTSPEDVDTNHESGFLHVTARFAPEAIQCH